MLHDFIKLTSHQNNKNSLDCANIRRNQTHSIFRQNEVCPVPLQIRTRPWPLIRKCHDYRCPIISCAGFGRFPTNVIKQTCLKEEALWKVLMSNNKKNVISLCFALLPVLATIEILTKNCWQAPEALKHLTNSETLKPSFQRFGNKGNAITD